MCIPVVAALELDDLLTLGVGTNKPEHAHASLGTAVGEAHHLHTAHRVSDHEKSQCLVHVMKHICVCCLAPGGKFCFFYVGFN
jgi:hypothetical protein